MGPQQLRCWGGGAAPDPRAGERSAPAGAPPRSRRSRPRWRTGPGEQGWAPSSFAAGAGGGLPPVSPAGAPPRSRRSRPRWRTGPGEQGWAPSSFAAGAGGAAPRSNDAPRGRHPARPRRLRLRRPRLPRRSGAPLRRGSRTERRHLARRPGPDRPRHRDRGKRRGGAVDRRAVSGDRRSRRASRMGTCSRSRRRSARPCGRGTRSQRRDAPGPRSAKDGSRFGFATTATSAGELVWAGYGITAPELGYDDYAGLDVKGKIVARRAGLPSRERRRVAVPRSAAFRYGEWRYKATNARDHGAAAVIGVRDDWNHPGDDDARRRGAARSRRAPASWRRARRSPRFARRASTSRALAAPGEEDGKPHSRPLGRPRVDLARARSSTSGRATANVVGVLPGRDPAVAAECVVVGAHHDHLGLGGDASLAPDRIGEVHPGRRRQRERGRGAARDRARRSRAEGPRAPHRGLRGVRRRGARAPRLGRARPSAARARARSDAMQLMVNLDMVGRPRSGRCTWTASRRRRAFARRSRRSRASGRPLPLELAFGEATATARRTTRASTRRASRPLLLHGRARRLPPPVGHGGQGERGGARGRRAARLPRRARDAADAAGAARGRARRRAAGARAAGESAATARTSGTIPDFAERERARRARQRGPARRAPRSKAGLARGRRVAPRRRDEASLPRGPRLRAPRAPARGRRWRSSSSARACGRP